MAAFYELQNIFGKSDDDYVKRKVSEARSTIYYSKNIDLLKSTDIRLDESNFQNAVDGRFIISYENIDFDCFFKRNTESDVLYVLFSGTRPAGQQEPTFKRWSYYKYLDGSILSIDDPMCKKYKNLHLGWYYGTNEESYCEYISHIVNTFAIQNGMQKIIFFASSGGGIAALYCACKIPNSMAVTVNPQIKLSLYRESAFFEKVTGLDLKTKDLFGRNNIPDMIKSSVNSKFLFIENSSSSEDMVQLNDLCNVLGTEFHYGLTQLTSNILSWVYQADLEAPHNAQEYVPMIFAIKYLIDNFDHASDFQSLYLILSELWKDHYDLLNEKARMVKMLYLSSGGSCLIKKQIVLHERDVLIDAKNIKYNCIKLYDSFKPNTVYSFSVNSIDVLSGTTAKITISIKDKIMNKNDFLETFDVEYGGNICFKTGSETKCKELLIYAGIASETNNISLKIGTIELATLESNDMQSERISDVQKI